MGRRGARDKLFPPLGSPPGLHHLHGLHYLLFLEGDGFHSGGVNLEVPSMANGVQ